MLKELAVCAIVYTLVRMVMRRSATLQHTAAERLSSLDALRWRSSPRIGMPLGALIGTPIRPDRVAPRVKTRRPSPLPLMRKPRQEPYQGLIRQAFRSSLHAILVLTLIGDGDQKELLQKQVVETGLKNAVSFYPPVHCGASLFQLLNDAHLAIATPLAEDTPRASFDAFARGLPLLAFDTAFFRDLAENGAVALATWPSAESLAERLVVLSQDRQRLARMAEPAIMFARENTQAYVIVQGVTREDDPERDTIHQALAFWRVLG